jgi:hypothetical protein
MFSACASEPTSWLANSFSTIPRVPFVLVKERREVDYEAKAVKLAGRR